MTVEQGSYNNFKSEMYYVILDNEFDKGILLLTKNKEKCEQYVRNWLENNRLMLAIRSEQQFERYFDTLMSGEEALGIDVYTYKGADE